MVRRHGFTFVSLASLVLSMVLSAAWVRGLYATDQWTWTWGHRLVRIQCGAGQFGLVLCDGWPRPVLLTSCSWENHRPLGFGLSVPYPREPFPDSRGRTTSVRRVFWYHAGTTWDRGALYPGGRKQSFRPFRMMCLHAWSPVAVTAMCPALWLARRGRGGLLRRSRLRAGQCAVCGYDLRASPGRCPECGTAAAPAAAVAVEVTA